MELQHEIIAEYLWDQHSQYIDDNSFSLSDIVGTSVMKRNEFKKVIDFILSNPSDFSFVTKKDYDKALKALENACELAAFNEHQAVAQGNLKMLAGDLLQENKSETEYHKRQTQILTDALRKISQSPKVYKLKDLLTWNEKAREIAFEALNQHQIRKG